MRTRTTPLTYFWCSTPDDLDAALRQRFAGAVPVLDPGQPRRARWEHVLAWYGVLEGKGAFGYNAQTDAYEDLLKAGIADPTKVVRTALQNAASVAGLMVTTEAMIAEKPKKEAGGGMPGGHGGMGGMGGMGDMDDMM